MFSSKVNVYPWAWFVNDLLNSASISYKLPLERAERTPKVDCVCVCVWAGRMPIVVAFALVRSCWAERKPWTLQWLCWAEKEEDPLTASQQCGFLLF